MNGVAVIMPTYNHGKYIADAIESFLMQKTSFPYHLYVSDDCSTDDTYTIASQFAVENPDRVTIIHKEHNEGLLHNYKTLLEAVDEDYIAILESDDRWCDPLKLQKQYDLMEIRPECGLCFTGCNLLKEGVLECAADVSGIVESHNGDLYSYLLLRALIWSPTIFFRKALYYKCCSIDEYIKHGFRTFDAPLILSIAANSKICFIKDITATYRISSYSISNNHSLKKRLAFERSANAIRSYVTSLYGYGGLKKSTIWMRENVLLLRIVWRYITGHK